MARLDRKTDPYITHEVDFESPTNPRIAFDSPTNPNIKPNTLNLIALLPDNDVDNADAGYGLWRSVRPRKGESCRWERTEREWVVVTVGEGEELGHVVVRSSRGQEQEVESYEAALRLGRVWCR